MAETGGIVVIDAETNDVSQFSSTAISDGCTFAASAGAKNNGSYGFNMVCNGVGNAARGNYTLADLTEVYARCYLKIDSTDYELAQNSGARIFCLYDGATMLLGLFVFRAAAGTGLYDTWRCEHPYGGDNSATNFALDSWIRAELHFKQAASGVTAECIINGDTVVSREIDSSLTAADRLAVGLESDVPPDGFWMYFDDIKVAATGPIGAYSESGGSIAAIAGVLNRRRRG